VALWLLVPPAHNLTRALQLSTTFLEAQRATGAVSSASAPELSTASFSLLQLPDVQLTPAALQSYPWLAAGPTDAPGDLVQVRARCNRLVLRLGSASLHCSHACLCCSAELQVSV
jgi:hypothetical protein